MEAGSGSERLMYTPHLKKVLKSYQASATKSLHGPNSVMGVWPPVSTSPDDGRSVSPPNPACAVTPSDLTKARPEKKAKLSSQPGPSGNKDALEFDPFIAPPPFPIQQPPIFTPADQTRCEKSETVLESETIACFNVGGEERLCLPQILNSVLRDFSLQQINLVCDTLRIYCSRCNQDQLEVLKTTGVLPASAPSCGLITKTDAQRLCAALLVDTSPLIVTKSAGMKPPFQVQVYHECFGRCSGLYTPDMFHAVHAPCVECVECHALLSPEKFVCHVHHPKETRTCHWGFDVHKWRAYIHLEVEIEENVELQEALKDMKERFGAKFKRKQILEENFEPLQKRVHVDSYYPYPYTMDPMLVYYYNATNSHLWDKAFQSYPVITKDGKTLCFPSEIPHLFPKSMHIRNRLTLTPANVQKLMPMKLPEESSIYAYQKASSRQLKKDDSITCFDSEDVHSDSSFSTISAGTEDGLMSNFDDEDELLPNTESELVEIKKAMTDIDSSVSTKILSEVETIIAKYRKCLHVSLQGKKLHYMELERKNCRQQAKIRKLEEKKLSLEREIKKLKSSSSTGVTEQSESQTERATPNPHPSSQPPEESVKDSTAPNDNTEDTNPEIPSEEGDTREIVRLESDETLPASSPPLPKQSPNLEAEPLGK